jgi:hypothetical protein
MRVMSQSPDPLARMHTMTNVRWAPPFVRHLGLEWLFRAAREPLRLGPFYLTINAAVVVIMVKTLIFKFPQVQALLRD